MSINPQQWISNTSTMLVIDAAVQTDGSSKERTLTPGNNLQAEQGQKMSLVVIRDIDELKQHTEAWQRLADKALEPNFCYEPWALIPAAEEFGREEDLRFVFIYTPDPLRPLGEKILCGFFPLVASRHYKKVPTTTLSLWKHVYCILCTPLVRSEYARDCLAAFFDWLASVESECKLMEFCHITGDRAFHHLLVDEMNRRASLSFRDESFNRALFKPHSHEPVFVEEISGRHKKELRRKLNRLSQTGRVEFVALEKCEELATWLEDFLRLEASGWKGAEDSAFASNESHRRFFHALATGAFENKRLMMLALRLNGKPIAMKFNLLTGRGAFAFKIAFDESYSQFSPGVLLEIENMSRLRAMPEIEWMDSCAVAEHFMINRLWTHRRTVETVVVSTGKPFADLLISVLPLLRWLNRRRKSSRGSNEVACVASN